MNSARLGVLELAIGPSALSLPSEEWEDHLFSSL